MPSKENFFRANTEYPYEEKILYGSIKLSSYPQGKIYIRSENLWRPLMAQNEQLNLSNVVCKQLGYAQGGSSFETAKIYDGTVY